MKAWDEDEGGWKGYSLSTGPRAGVWNVPVETTEVDDTVLVPVDVRVGGGLRARAVVCPLVGVSPQSLHTKSSSVQSPQQERARTRTHVEGVEGEGAAVSSERTEPGGPDSASRSVGNEVVVRLRRVALSRRDRTRVRALPRRRAVAPVRSALLQPARMLSAKVLRSTEVLWGEGTGGGEVAGERSGGGGGDVGDDVGEGTVGLDGDEAVGGSEGVFAGSGLGEVVVETN